MLITSFISNHFSLIKDVASVEARQGYTHPGWDPGTSQGITHSFRESLTGNGIQAGRVQIAGG